MLHSLIWLSKFAIHSYNSNLLTLEKQTYDKSTILVLFILDTEENWHFIVHIQRSPKSKKKLQFKYKILT